MEVLHRRSCYPSLSVVLTCSRLSKQVYDVVLVCAILSIYFFYPETKGQSVHLWAPTHIPDALPSLQVYYSRKLRRFSMAQTRPSMPGRCPTDELLARPKTTTKSSTRRRRSSMRITSSIDDLGQVQM